MTDDPAADFWIHIVMSDFRSDLVADFTSRPIAHTFAFANADRRSISSLLDEALARDRDFVGPIRDLFLSPQGRSHHLLPLGVTPAAWNPATQPLEQLRWSIAPHNGLVHDAGDLGSQVFMSLAPADLRALAEDMYVRGDPRHFVIRVRYGRGGGDGILPDLVDWLLTVGVDVGLPLVRDTAIVGMAGLLWRGSRTGRRARRARAVARVWDEYSSIIVPRQLREFLDLRTDWTPAVVAQRLRIPEASAIQLLRALGFVPNAGGTWVLGVSKKALGRRAKWLRREDRYLDDAEDLHRIDPAWPDL